MGEHNDADLHGGRRKMSHTISQGYRCNNCLTDTVVYGELEPAPEKCLNCQQVEPKLHWKDEIWNDTTVRTIKL